MEINLEKTEYTTVIWHHWKCSSLHKKIYIYISEINCWDTVRTRLKKLPGIWITSYFISFHILHCSNLPILFITPLFLFLSFFSQLFYKSHFLQIYALTKMLLSGIGGCVHLAWWQHSLVNEHNQLVSAYIYPQTKPDKSVWHKK